MIVVACLGLATCLLLWWPPDPSRRVAAWLNRRHQSRTVRSVAGWTRGTDGRPPPSERFSTGAMPPVKPHAVKALAAATVKIARTTRGAKTEAPQRLMSQFLLQNMRKAHAFCTRGARSAVMHALTPGQIGRAHV